jgi:hypothetical protein
LNKLGDVRFGLLAALNYVLLALPTFSARRTTLAISFTRERGGFPVVLNASYPAPSHQMKGGAKARFAEMNMTAIFNTFGRLDDNPEDDQGRRELKPESRACKTSRRRVLVNPAQQVDEPASSAVHVSNRAAQLSQSYGLPTGTELLRICGRAVAPRLSQRPTAKVTKKGKARRGRIARNGRLQRR